MIDSRPPNFIDAETNAGELIYKHINHYVWLYPRDGYSVYILVKINGVATGKIHELTKEEYEKLLVMLDVI